MNKAEFLNELQKGLSGLPQDDIKERLEFYSEMIDDYTEEGKSEAEAVAEIGSVNQTISQIIADIPIKKLVKEKVTPKRSLRAWEIVLIVLGFPVWFPALIALAAIILSLYITLWAVIISLWAIEVSFVACAVSGIVLTAFYFAQNAPFPALLALGTALFSTGISLFMFFGCIGASKGIVKLTKKAIIGIKSMLIRKESAK